MCFPFPKELNHSLCFSDVGHKIFISNSRPLKQLNHFFFLISDVGHGIFGRRRLVDSAVDHETWRHRTSSRYFDAGRKNLTEKQLEKMSLKNNYLKSQSLDIKPFPLSKFR
jgi:hypothetical protein